MWEAYFKSHFSRPIFIGKQTADVISKQGLTLPNKAQILIGQDFEIPQKLMSHRSAVASCAPVPALVGL